MKICKDPDTNEIPFGPYPLLLLTINHEILCQDCANNSKEKCIEGDIYYEGPEIECDGCGSMISSAYGEPDEIKSN